MENVRAQVHETGSLNDQGIIQRVGISYRNHTYWHSDLANFIGKVVSIKAYGDSPDKVEIFCDDQLICVAERQE